MRTGVPERPLQMEHADLSLLGNREENQDRVAIAIDDDAAQARNAVLPGLLFDIQRVAAAHDDRADFFRHWHDLIDTHTSFIAGIAGIATNRAINNETGKVFFPETGL